MKRLENVMENNNLALSFGPAIDFFVDWGFKIALLIFVVVFISSLITTYFNGALHTNALSVFGLTGYLIASAIYQGLNDHHRGY
ncbi:MULTISPECIES: hypothetical protein [Vibrio]|uniref:Uncharacterized protein n=7 Tax=Bacteria TaxID=2 RepID=A0AA47JN18_VIBPH|nr:MULTISPECIES: hypothetical protein [Vibrio]EJG1066109.1 hypothetical protein [Vibrio parahaemolyticus O1]MDW1807431.1 hypothetical protein [Vibrio sp. Vb2362]MDW2296410.1 hypothetical protein [Vibrio sp. 1404]OOH98656.1 hypothetical protein BIW16_18825 [Vibrio sp. OULL4]ALR95555.1 hypothetical protein AT730_25220 [Vibrio alginolyticus]